ncbi:MAG: FAD-binding protein [Actinobacteria bacterium]|nr:FAD-binding protein [Actinomycetota bacterium]
MRQNWAGTYEYTAPRIVAATSIEEVRRAVTSGGRVHALGTRHSFTDLPDTAGTLIDVSGMAPEFALDEAARTVTVSAGTRYGVLAMWLDARGWALHNLGSLPHISVGGAIATATHGSGDRNGVLTTAVRGIRYVGGDGDLHYVHRGDPDFDALAVGLGAYGVTVAVTLEIQPSYRARQDIYRGLTWEALFEQFDQVTGAGYSVSVFTQWDAADLGHIWVKTRLDTDADVVPDELAGALRDRVVGPALTPVLESNVTEQGGVPGPWMLRLPHFRLDAEPSYGDEIQTEYFVRREDGPAALRSMLALAPAIRPHLLVSELRTAAADGLWLSGAYQRDILAIHFTWRNDPVGVGSVLPAIEAALAPFDARPHWGKVHGFDAGRRAAVHPRLADARAVFERLDPEGLFVNAHLERNGVRESR